MKLAVAIAVLPVWASAFVLPESVDQVPLSGPEQHDAQTVLHGDLSDLVLSAEQIIDDFSGVLEDVSTDIQNTAKAWKTKWDEFLANVETEIIGAEIPEDEPDHRHPDLAEYTLYQLLRVSNYTKKFADLVDEHPKVVKLLNSTDGGNHTLFLPIDKAFEHVPPNHKPSFEAVEKFLLYHIAVGNYGTRELLHAHTIPTVVEESWLGGDAQRLRVRVGLSGLKLNFYNSITPVGPAVKNGLVHIAHDILLPPLMVGQVLSLLPDKFSTLLLAYSKTDFVQFIHGVHMVGSTVFAPDNAAFSRLGPRANAFLFNSPTGLKYLKAILKYHIVANATLYSDAFYDHTTEGAQEQTAEHFDLTTLLNDVHVGVDIGKVLGFTTMRVNGFARVEVQDGISKNGVIQLVDRVLIPPHKRGDGEQVFGTDNIDVEELKERLAEYV